MLSLPSSHAWTLVARDGTEAADLASAHPGTAIVTATGLTVPPGGDPVAIVGCALGPIHPAPTQLTCDIAAVTRDVAIIEGLLAALPSVPVHIVFVSSVLALSPRRQRAGYAGWKNTIEAALAALAARHGRARLSVVYPGRLVESSHPLLATPYVGLARRLLGMLEAAEPRRLIIGRDARTWLGGRGFATWWAAIRGGGVL
jgi:hypothetical protein